MTLSREAEPSGELAKDEFTPHGGSRARMRVSGGLFEVFQSTGRWYHGRDGENLWSRDKLTALAANDPDPNGWPRALAFFEEHCGKGSAGPVVTSARAPEPGEVAPECVPDGARWCWVTGRNRVERPAFVENNAVRLGSRTGGGWATSSPSVEQQRDLGSAFAHLLAGELGSVAVKPAPADGPAKVFENETEAFGHLIAGPRDWRGKQAYDWLKLRGVNVEGVMLKALPRILERLPAEQAVQAMGKETREAVGVMLMPWCMSEITKTRSQRDEALARAEKAGASNQKLSLALSELAAAHLNQKERAEQAEANASMWETTSLCDTKRREEVEEQLRKLQESYDFVHEGRGKQRERAERERDEARLAVSAWVTAQGEMHRLALAAGKAMDDAEQKLRALVGAEVTYNG